MSAPQTSPSLLIRLRDPSDKPAWQLFFDLYSPSLLAIAQSKGLRGADADDIVQESLLRCLRTLPEFKYDPARRFRGLLTTIVTNLCMDEHRRRGRRPVNLGSDGLSALPTAGRDDTPPGGDEARSAMDEMVAAIVDRLPSEQRSLFLMTFVESLSDKVISMRLGISEGNVRVKRCRILQSLRERQQEFSAFAGD